MAGGAGGLGTLGQNGINGTCFQLSSYLLQDLWEVGGSGRWSWVSWGPWNSHPCPTESQGEEQRVKGNAR